MLLSFEPLDEIYIVSGSRIAALYYTDHVTLFCLHAQSLELILKHWNRLLDTMPTETFLQRAHYPNSWHDFTTGNGRDSREGGSPWTGYPTANAVTVNLTR